MEADDDLDWPGRLENVDETDDEASEKDRSREGHGDKAGTGEIEGEGDVSLVNEGDSESVLSSRMLSIFVVILEGHRGSELDQKLHC